jgi:RNA polymerase sigma-70 factor, ECF subfamily
METVRRTRPRRRQSLSLRHLAPVRSRPTERGRRSIDAAFESFYREHVSGVYQYALAVLANPADAEDVTQQTFLNAYRAFQRGERPRKPHNWLIKIAHNVCRMRWREASRRPQELPLEDVREPIKLEDDGAITLDEVLAALGRLPFNQRAALVMRELEDRSYAEIADVLGTSVSAVEALLFRARTNLRATRKVLGALTLVPVPGSLSSFFGGGSGSAAAVAAGGTVIGADIVLKAAAVVATGVVVGGLGYKSVNAIATAEPVAAAAVQRGHQLPVWADPATPLEHRAAANVSRSAARGIGSDGWGGYVARGNQLKTGYKPADPDEGSAGDASAQAPGAGAAAAPAPAVAVAAPAPAAPVAAPAVNTSSPSSAVSATTAPVTSVLSPPPPAPAPAPAPLPTTDPTSVLPLPTVPVTVPTTVPTLPTIK